MKNKVQNWLHQLSAHVEERRREFESSKEKQERKLSKVVPKKAPQEEETKKVEVEISAKTVIKVLIIVMLALAASEIIVELKSILIMTGVSAILVLGISPMLDKIESYNIPRPLAIVVLYIIFLGVLTTFFIQLVPIIVEQLINLSIDLRSALSGPMEMPQWAQMLGIDADSISKLLAENIGAIATNIQSVAGSTFDVVGSIFSSLLSLLTTLILLFFMFLERERLGRSILHLFPAASQKSVQKRTIAVQHKMAEWFRGQFILMVLVGLFVYIWMTVLHFSIGYEYALTVALLAAFAELLPYVGPFLTYILVGLIGIEISWSALFIGLAMVGITQFLEGNFLVPVVMKRAVGISSVVIILALLIGGSLGYAMGGIGTALVAMIFSIPIAATIGLFIEGDHSDDTRAK